MRPNHSSVQPFTPSLTRIGLATPPPFIGRAQELGLLRDAITGFTLLILHGAVGAGKTRLAAELSSQLTLSGEFQVTRVPCSPGDLGVAIIARAERAMDKAPGSLASVLLKENRLLVLDDVHHLPSEDIAQLVHVCTQQPGIGRLLLITRDILPLPRNDERRFDITVEGLAEGCARVLWTHLEDLYGKTGPNACDKALAKTRGMPLAMRREYARTRYGKDAWELDALSASTKKALEALCVARLPAAPAAISALLEETEVEAPLIELVSRQLIDPLETGRFSVHDVVRDQVLAVMAFENRKKIELKAVELILGTGRGVGPHRPAWTAGDDGAIALLDEVDRSREILMHLIAAKQFDAAIQELERCTEIGLLRGAGGEILAQIAHLRSLGVTDPILSKVSAMVAIRHGRIADALEQGLDLPETQRAYLQYRTGSIQEARTSLVALCQSPNADTSAVAACTLAEIELDANGVTSAESLLLTAFENRAQLSQSSLASLHFTFARIELYKNNFSAARAALARATSLSMDREFYAKIEVLRVRNLIEEDRYSEASKHNVEIASTVTEIDCISLRDELSFCEALVSARIGDTNLAIQSLQQQISAARLRSDEIGALHGEFKLCHILIEVGKLSSAASIVHSLALAAKRFCFSALQTSAKLLNARIALLELRIDMASEQLQEIDSTLLSVSEQKIQKSVQSEIDAWKSKKVTNEAESDLESARIAIAMGNSAAALHKAKHAAVYAERIAYSGLLAKALVIVARLELARGQNQNAFSAASRAVREAQKSGTLIARTEALLVLAALSNEKSALQEASTYARDAKNLATQAGLSVQKQVAEQALEIISNDGQPLSGGISKAGAATNSAYAQQAVQSFLADLGFCDAKPIRCVSASGPEYLVASASPELLGVGERSLAVDAIRQVVVRQGEIVANVKRRSLLKRLLFLFSSNPGQVFTKEEIVEKVWEIEYHPLRHDAALFTNIMRIRRLLGTDGNEIIQVSENGYFLNPPKDFLFVEDTREKR